MFYNPIKCVYFLDSDETDIKMTVKYVNFYCNFSFTIDLNKLKKFVLFIKIIVVNEQTSVLKRENVILNIYKADLDK